MWMFCSVHDTRQNLASEPSSAHNCCYCERSWLKLGRSLFCRLQSTVECKHPTPYLFILPTLPPCWIFVLNCFCFVLSWVRTKSEVGVSWEWVSKRSCCILDFPCHIKPRRTPGFPVSARGSVHSVQTDIDFPLFLYVYWNKLHPFSHVAYIVIGVRGWRYPPQDYYGCDPQDRPERYTLCLVCVWRLSLYRILLVEHRVVLT